MTTLPGSGPAAATDDERGPHRHANARLLSFRHDLGALPTDHPRRRSAARFEALVAELNAHDQHILDWARRRRQLLDRLLAERDRLWPPDRRRYMRRPPTPEHRPLPPVAGEPRWVSGRELRSTCLALLARHGALTLVELHALLHLHGYAITGRHPVKALAMAMRYEHERGRARRVERGLYGLSPSWRPRRGRHGGRPLPDVAVDPAVRHAFG